MEGRRAHVAAEVNGRSRGLPRLFGRLLFPHFCVSCDAEGAVLCAGCRAAQPPLTGVFACPSCRVGTPFGSRCASRACGRTALDGLIAAAPYGNRVASRLIRLYKYEGVDEAAAEIGPQFDRFLVGLRPTLAAVLGDATVASVPLHFLREAGRGFNQADFFADRVATALGLGRVRGVLRRGGFSWSPQARLQDPARRVANASGAYAVVRRGAVGDWVIVDDVATTGATLQECAKALKAAGARKVWGLTLLRG
jgi:predicted amidophosphoribosyltransferase